MKMYARLEDMHGDELSVAYEAAFLAGVEAGRRNLWRHMITRPTVFILGAGASAPYGFPLGERLVQLIIDEVQDNPVFVADIQEANQGADLQSFVTELRRREPHSIDEFLQRHQEFLKSGKACIARALIPFERPTELQSIA